MADPANLCLTVPLPHQATLMDLMKNVDLSLTGCPRKETFTFTKSLGKLPIPPINPVSAGWQPAASFQAQSRLDRARTSVQPMVIYDFVSPSPGALDLKIIEDMQRKYEEMIHRTMVAPLHMRERRHFPDPTHGLEEAIRIDCCESSRWAIGFGTVVESQEDFDQDTIERWIWGPNGEFTGFPAGDPAFEETWKEVRRSDRTEVTRLLEFSKIDIQFRFTPRYTMRQMRDPQNYGAYDAYHQGRARSHWSYMVQFATYHDQAEWVKLARHAAQEELRSPMRLQRGF